MNANLTQNMKSITLFWLALCCSGISFAQSVTPTKGKEFWFGFMKNYEVEEFQESLDVFVVSNQNTSGTISIPGQGYSQSFNVVANVTTTLTLDNAIAEVFSNQIIEGRGILIETEDTVAVFAINFNGYTADGTKVLPTQTLGTEYMVASYYGLSGYSYNSEFLIVATEDDTEVEIIPSAPTMGGNAAGVPFVVQLNEGEVYQVRAAGSADDFTGTIVRGTVNNGACRPFAVFSGVDCTNIPSTCYACDHIYEQNFPVETWGTDFFVAPFGGATQYTYRVLAYSDNTSISIDGGAAITLNAGQWNEFNSVTGAHCVIADQGIAVIQYMEGVTCAGNGDPAMLILNDANQKIDNITFATVVSTVITSHNLTVIIEADDLGNVTLDGVVIDPNTFLDFPSCTDHVYATITLTAGSHTLDAPGEGVTAYVYGSGGAESYAYSVGSFSPVPPIIIDEAICTNDQVILEISQNYYDPYWYNYTVPGDTIALGYQYIIDPPIENGIYVGVGNDYVSGCEEEFYFSVEVPTPPVINISQSATQICQYQSVQLEANALPSNAVYFYSWSPTAGLSDPYISNPVATPIETTTYTVTVTTPTECATNTADITIEVIDGIITLFEVTPEESQFCLGGEVELETDIQTEIMSDNFDPGISWGVWNSIDNGEASANCGSVDGNGLYFNGPAPRRATTNAIDISDGGTINFTLKVANGVAPCDNAEPGDNIVLSYSTNGGANWTPIQTFFEAAYSNFTSLSISAPAGAETANTLFRWEQIGTYAAGQDNWVIDNVYIGVNDPTPFDFSWTPSAGLTADDIANPTASPIVSTWYFVETLDPLSGCSYSDSVFVDVGQPFDLEMMPDTGLCDVQGIQIYADPSIAGNYTWLWSPNTNISGLYSQNPTVSPTSTTTYSVVVNSDQGCSQTGEVQISVSTLLDLSVSASDQSICAGEVIELVADMGGNNSGITFEWSPVVGVTDPNAAITDAQPLVNTTYIVVAIHEDSGCQLTDAVAISVLQVFTVTVDPQDIALCITDGLELTATASTNAQLSWSWSPANLVTVNNLPVTIMTENTSADLIITATDAAGCQAIDTAHVVLLVETTDLGPDLGFCEDQFVTLNTGWPADYTIAWSNGESTPDIIVNEGGLFTVEVTSPGGCYSEDEVLLTLYAYPVVGLGLDDAYCQGEMVTLDASNAGMNFLWSTGETTEEVTVMSSDLYSVTVDNGYCFSSDEISIIFNPLPVNEMASDTLICFGFPPYFITLDAGNDGSTYLWNNGEVFQTLNAMSPGLYSVEVSSGFGCIDEFYVTVGESCDGSIYIPNSFTPNGDGINDVWFVYGENIERFNVEIYNRWGEQIFTSQDPTVPWLGQRRDGDQYVQNEVYSYRVSYRLKDAQGALSEELLQKGHISVIR